MLQNPSPTSSGGTAPAAVGCPGTVTCCSVTCGPPSTLAWVVTLAKVGQYKSTSRRTGGRMLLNDVIAGASLKRRADTALVWGGGSHAFAELAGRATRLAGGLSRLTYPGERVAILADNCVEYLDCMYGASTAGNILTLVNQRLAGP